MATMVVQQVPNRKSRKRGYVAFLICGICVALNLLAYLPPQTFEQAEATEFTVTLLLLLVFVLAGFIAAISTVKNRGDGGLVSLLLLTLVFAAMSNFSGSWEWKLRIALQLSYAILVLTLGTIGLLATQRQAR
jgi:uncharacterized membrane protein YhaH (DUF805 family)